ncbi:MAG: hypothetical protein WC969_11145 [Elusimicrobiota bacterium]
MTSRLKKFLSTALAFFLGAESSGAVGAGMSYPSDGSVRSEVPDVSKVIDLKSAQGRELFRLKMARTNVPSKMWNDALALSILADEIYKDPQVAREFSEDPMKYLKKIGCEDVKLRLDAMEVRIVMALGDASVRSALETRDPKAFLTALESRGLFTYPEKSHFLIAFKDELMKVSDSDEQVTAAVAAAYVIAAVASQAAVAYNVVAVLNVAVETNVAVHSNVATDSEAGSSSSLNANPSGPYPDNSSISSSSSSPIGMSYKMRNVDAFQMASYMGGAEFAKGVSEEFVREYSARIVSGIEGLSQFKGQTVLKKEDLSTLVQRVLKDTYRM